MKNSEKYFHGVAGFIEDMAEINAAYDKEIRYLEPYRGSEGFTQGVQKAQAVRDADVQRMRETYLKQFRETVQQMREAINHRPLVPPTPEQTSLLSVLSMLSKWQAVKLRWPFLTIWPQSTRFADGSTGKRLPNPSARKWIPWSAQRFLSSKRAPGLLPRPYPKTLHPA